jgi:hypothetical protein
MRLLALGALLAACTPPPPSPERAAPPSDHGPAFVLRHDGRPAAECATCHGPEPCVRCHRADPPRDHRPGFAGPAHAAAARLDVRRCAACHTPPLCARCHR